MKFDDFAKYVPDTKTVNIDRAYGVLTRADGRLFAKRWKSQQIMDEFVTMKSIPSHAGIAHCDRLLIIDADYAAIVFEYVDGYTIENWPIGIGIDDVNEVGRLLTDAVNHIHANGYVHGDVNESNVIITTGCRPVLIDFELAAPATQEGRDKDMVGIGKAINRLRQRVSVRP